MPPPKSRKPPPESFGFVCDAFEMKQALATVKPAVVRRGGALPVLSGVRVSAADGAVTLLASDLELTISTPLRAAMVNDGVAVLPAVVTGSFVKGATKTQTGRLTVRAEGEDVALTFGPRFRQVRTLPADEFPRLSVIPESSAVIDVSLFGEVLQAASTDCGRPILTGVYLDDGHVVATDSYRLYVTDGPSHADIGWSKGSGPLIPRTAVAQIAKRGGSPTIAFTEREVSFSWPDGTTITSRLIEGDFPNYSGLIPASHPNRCTFNRAELTEGLRSLAAIGASDVPVTINQAADTITLSRQIPDVASESITLTRSVYEGTAGSVHFNPSYLLDAVRSMTGETVEMRTFDDIKPALLVEDRILGGQRTRLLMPVRVR